MKQKGEFRTPFAEGFDELKDEVYFKKGNVPNILDRLLELLSIYLKEDKLYQVLDESLKSELMFMLEQERQAMEDKNKKK